MMLDKKTGRYRFIDTKWLRFFVRTPKTTDGWEMQFEVGQRYRGPGVWAFTGKHPVLTLWFSSEHSLDIIYVCGKCSLCELIHNAGTSSRRKLKATWT